MINRHSILVRSLHIFRESCDYMSEVIIPEYQLEIKQIVDYPRCRIYRQFIQSLIADRSIRTSGGSGLFYFTALSCYANFRVSYRRLDGITYTVCPGEWICRIKELQQWFRVHFQHQAIAILDSLQKLGVITYTRINRGLVKYSITGWRRHNTVLDYNCPCQKESGFFFLPIATAAKLIQSGPASEMDVVLDLWISAIYQDERVAGSDLGPVVYFRNGTGNPLVSYSELAPAMGTLPLDCRSYAEKAGSYRLSGAYGFSRALRQCDLSEKLSFNHVPNLRCIGGQRGGGPTPQHRSAPAGGHRAGSSQAGQVQDQRLKCPFQRFKSGHGNRPPQSGSTACGARHFLFELPGIHR